MYISNPYFGSLCINGGRYQDHCAPDFMYNSGRILQGQLNGSESNYYTKEGDVVKMRCLPYVYLVGVTKAGTTDLYSKLLHHPDIVEPSMKEPMWFDRNRIGR